MEDKPTLEERGRALRVIINRVRGRIAEQERLLSELEAHAMLLELGIDPELIDTFLVEAKNQGLKLQRPGFEVVEETEVWDSLQQ